MVAVAKLPVEELLKPVILMASGQTIGGDGVSEGETVGAAVTEPLTDSVLEPEAVPDAEGVTDAVPDGEPDGDGVCVELTVCVAL